MGERGDARRPAPTPPAVPWFLASRWRLLGALCLTLALPMGAFTFFVSAQVRRSLEAQAVYQNTVAARLAANAVREHFEGLTRYVESFARRPLLAALVQRKNAEGVRAHLKDLVIQHGSLDRAFITDARGRLWSDYPHVPEVIGRDFSFRDWYRGVSGAQTTYVSEVYRRAAPPQPHLVAIATPIRDDRREPLGYLVAQHTIETLTDWLAQVRPSAGGAVALIDHHGVLAMTADAGAPPPPPLGEHPVIRRALAGEAGSVVTADPLTGEPSLVSYWPVGPMGWVVLSRQPVAVVSAPVRALQRTIVGLATVSFLAMCLLGILCLNTSRRSHEAFLESDRQLEAASRHKSEFLANMSHELRTPLNAVIGFSEVLREQTVGPLNEKQARYVTNVWQSGKHLLQLINDILDLSKVEAGKMVLEPEPLDVATTLEEILVVTRGLAHQKAQRIETEIAPRLPSLRADAVRFKQICFNLLSNAVKFTPQEGRITLGARRAPGAADLLEIRVADTGIGIKAEDLPRLFQEFVQLEAAATKRFEGTGLGLALSKRLVELHGGRIRAESEGEGRGTTFTVVVPFAGPPERPEPPA